jgi:tetratricopeptide (TPR) repeat protein
MKRTLWLQEKKDFFITRVVREFLKSVHYFNEIKNEYEQDELTYEKLDIWVGTADRKGVLWDLKDMCHTLWGDADPSTQTSMFMFDWMTGALFHEAMKLKENCYMLHRYEPSLKNLLLSADTKYDMDDECTQFFNETVMEIKNSIRRMECMMSRAEHNLIELITEERDNRHLIRYLLDTAFSDDTAEIIVQIVQKILKKLFPDNLARAYYMAGESYLEGHWYTTARNAFEKALNIDPACQEARKGLRALEKQLKDILVMIEQNSPT